MDAAKNRLNGFASTANAQPNPIRVPDMPRLSDFIKDNGLVAGAAKYDEAMEQWRLNHEKTLNAQFTAQAKVSTSGVQ